MDSGMDLSRGRWQTVAVPLPGFLSYGGVATRGVFESVADCLCVCGTDVRKQKDEYAGCVIITLAPHFPFPTA